MCVNLANSGNSLLQNGFWFGTGWALILFVPTIITSVKLSKYYRRMKECEGYGRYWFIDLMCISTAYHCISSLYLTPSCGLSFINVTIKLKILIQVKTCKFWFNIFYPKIIITADIFLTEVHVSYDKMVIDSIYLIIYLFIYLYIY